MKAKKLLSLLLALIMCAGLVPAQVLAAGNKTIVINTDGVENGTVEIVSIPDDATQDGKITAMDEYYADDGAPPQWRLDKRIGTPVK